MAGLAGAALAAGGPPAAFAALPAAQIGYAIACRAPTARNGTFTSLVGAAAAVHAAAVMIPALGSVAGAGGPVALAALAAGFAWPFLVGGLKDEIVVMGGLP
jgi:hypothetical protein